MLILASASPRRQELLRHAGIRFTVHPSDIEETLRVGESPVDCAQRLATEKALAVSGRYPQDFVLGADTIVVVEDAIFGKPSDADDASRMLRSLSGRTHKVITGICLASPVAGNAKQLRAENRELTTTSETTLVTMCTLTDNEIRNYIASGEPMDKAGAYAIQGLPSRWIPRIEGDYTNVVGLPVALVYRMLQESGALPK